MKVAGSDQREEWKEFLFHPTKQASIWTDANGIAPQLFRKDLCEEALHVLP